MADQVVAADVAALVMVEQAAVLTVRAVLELMRLVLAAVADGEHPVEQQGLALVGLAEEPLR